MPLPFYKRAALEFAIVLGVFWLSGFITGYVVRGLL